MKVVAGILIPSVAIILYLLGNSWVKNFSFQFVGNQLVNQLIKFQVYGLLLSLLTLGLTLLLAPDSKQFLRFGDLSAVAAPVKLLGIKAGDSWYKTGGSFLVVITLVTALFMYAGLGKTADWSRFWEILPFILLFSATNAFNEEIITRFSVVGLLDGVVSPLQIVWAAALIFGLVHYFGNPGGPAGVLMAGCLGWILAKSVIETGGIGTAFIIHFVQDIVIYTLLLISTHKP